MRIVAGAGILRRVLSLLIVAVMSMAVMENEARILMASVGINRYEHPGVMSLRLAENDARDIARLMAGGDSDIRLVVGRNATRATIVRQLKELAAKAGPDDVLCLFFSGHGFKGGMAVYDTKSYDTLLSYKELGAIFKTSKARKKVIIADTCHSGSMRMGKRKATAEDLKRIKNQDILLFLSSRDNEQSMEASGGMRNGIFTTFVIRGLNGEADINRDKAVTARELFDYVSRAVVRITRQRQHPVMWGKFDANMILTSVRH